MTSSPSGSKENWKPHENRYPTHEAVTAVFRATLLNTLLALPPRDVMAVTQTTTIRASMTAYSTAVGPSSVVRKRTTDPYHERMSLRPFLVPNLRPRQES